MKIRWLPQSVDDLESVRRYIAQNDPSAASAMARRIRRAVRMLSDYPAAGRPGRVPGTRELVVAGTAYTLPYRARAGVIEILRVLHGARKWPND
ncbi:MAG: type II toxin-antitoxin system RelE/ParE family toxin [Candidatus Binataceae bacterium]